MHIDSQKMGKLQLATVKQRPQPKYRIAYLTIIIKCGSTSFHQVTFCTTVAFHVPTSLRRSGSVFVALLNVNVCPDGPDATQSRQASRWLHGRWTVMFCDLVFVHSPEGNDAGRLRNQTCCLIPVVPDPSSWTRCFPSWPKGLYS